MNRLKDKYMSEVKPKLKEEFKLTSDLAVPKLNKVIVNIGSSEMKDDVDLKQRLSDNLALLAGQKPVVTKSKKSISAFKLVKGQTIGLMVTLRREKMYAFLDRLMNVVLPKVRDFRGINTSGFDSKGNFNLGLREQMIFPEVDAAATKSSFRGNDKIKGLQITVVTTAKNKEQGLKLLEFLGMPFRKGAN